MAQYRKKPVVIEAWRYEYEGLPQPKWLVEATEKGVVWGAGDSLSVQTLEGIMMARPGDWIIRGVEGEIYPCKDSVFQATYEAV